MALTESDLTEFLRLLKGDETRQMDFACVPEGTGCAQAHGTGSRELREAFRSAVLTKELLPE